MANSITYHRKPTMQEINFGHGATHYKDFERDACINKKTGKLKRWLICPFDGLRYYR